MYKLLVYSDELYHYGVKGMRWGIRRYQNYDGTRIGTGGEPVTNPSHSGHPQRIRDTVVGGQGGKATGNARLAANASGATSGDKKKSIAEVLTEPSVRQGKGKDNISPLEDATRDVNKVTDSGKKLTEIGKKYDPKVKEAGDKAEQEAKKMSDKELRDKINRIKMEKEYRSLAESDVESGWDKAHEILEVAGDVVGILGSLASLYLTYKLAKGKIGHSDVSDAEHELKSFMESNEFDDEVIAHFMDLDDEYVETYLEHHGIKGMKWGVRRYQNYDGTRIGTGSGPVTKTGDRIARKKSEQKSSIKAFDKKISRLERTGADPSRIDRKRAERDQVDRAYNKKISRLESKQVAEQKTIEDRIARKKAERDQAIKPFDNKISRLERNGADKDRIDRKKDEREQVAKSFDKKIDSLVKKYENVKLDQLAAKKSIAGGQDGKAEGNARFAASVTGKYDKERYSKDANGKTLTDDDFANIAKRQDYDAVSQRYWIAVYKYGKGSKEAESFRKEMDRINGTKYTKAHWEKKVSQLKKVEKADYDKYFSSKGYDDHELKDLMDIEYEEAYEDLGLDPRNALYKKKKQYRNG